jgi:hypothetical protein
VGGSVEVSSAGAGVASAGDNEAAAAFGEVDSFDVSAILRVYIDTIMRQLGKLNPDGATTEAAELTTQQRYNALI